MRLPLTDFAWLWVAGFFAVLGGTATVAVLELDDDFVTSFMLRPLYPGLYVAYKLLHLEHSGLLYLVSAFTNAGTYGFAILFIRLLWRYLADARSFRSTH